MHRDFKLRRMCMLTPYESRLGLVWLANAAGRIHHRRPEAVALAEWVNEHIEALAAGLAGQGCGIDVAGLAEAAAKCQETEMPRNRVASNSWQSLRAVLRRASDATQAIKADSTALRLQRLARIARLDDADLQVVEMLLRYQTQPALESLLDDVYNVGPAKFSRYRGPSLKKPAFCGVARCFSKHPVVPLRPRRAAGPLRSAGGGRRWRRVPWLRACPRLASAPDETNRPATPAAGRLRKSRTGMAGLRPSGTAASRRGRHSAWRSEQARQRCQRAALRLPRHGQDAVCPHPGNPPGRCAVQRGRDQRKRR